MIRAMTLLELMVVVAMVGILAGLAISSQTGAARNQRALAEMKGVALALREFRDWAATERRCVRITTEAQRLLATPLSSCGSTSTALTAEARARTFSADVQVLGWDTAEGSVVFRDQGGTDQSGAATLSYQNMRTGQVRALRVWPAIGVIRDAD